MNTEKVSSIKNVITSNAMISSEMASVCLAIIEHLSVGVKKKNHLTFAELYRISPKVSDEKFYDAVFYLTKKHTNVLTQEFEALHPRNGFIQVPDKQQILDDMREAIFFNPFTGQELSADEFGEQVITYFTPSKEFVEAVNG